MTDSSQKQRAHAESTGRVTFSGKDQFALACLAREVASDGAFNQIRFFEDENRAYRAELHWLRRHSNMRTAR